MTDRNEAQIPLSRLEDAVQRGVISAEQLAALRAMPEPVATAPAAEPSAAPAAAEAARGLNAVSIAYSVGAAAVVFAFGWFIVDRWDALGPAGVLGVSLLYAGIFILTSRVVGRLGFRTASALAVLLAVAMTPVAAWSVLELGGLWYEPGIPRDFPYFAQADVLETLRWIPIDLAAALAALVALRRVHFAVLALPVAIALPLVVGHAMPLFFDPDIVPVMVGWMAFVSAVALVACGYWVDRHPRDDEDYARWVYLVGLCTLAFALLAEWDAMGYLRHGLPVLAVGLFALSLLLRRPIFVVFGALGVFCYLAYLAFDVFRTALSFPIVLATFGASVIVIAVWLQRRYPALARRVEARQRGQRIVPHAGLAFGGAIVVAVALMAAQLPDAHERARSARVAARRNALAAYREQRHRPRHRPVPQPESPGRAGANPVR